MTLHASWVHGTTCRSEWVGDNLAKVNGTRWDQSAGDVNWSDINGLPRGFGMTFRGKNSMTHGFGGTSTTGPFDAADPFRFSQKGYWFHFGIPTPVISAGSRARLLRVFTMWDATDGVLPLAMHVWDGPSRVATLPFASGRGRSGLAGTGDLVDGITRFNLPAPHTVIFGIGLSIGVAFQRDGDITFSTAGADFDI